MDRRTRPDQDKNARSLFAALKCCPRLAKKLIILAAAVPLTWFIASALELDQFVKKQLASLSQTVKARAAIVIEEDFASGLDAWQGDANLGRDWAYSGSGSVRPAQLALYAPSLPLSNYEMDFRAIIEAGGIGWVFRAADASNYYAAKIVIEKVGPPPVAALVRNAVANGKPGPRVRTPILFHVQPNMQHHVRMSVSGNQFLISLDGQVVDSWTDGRFGTGGIGFFCDKGEKASILHLRIACQNDEVGRLCAYLVPGSRRAAGSPRNR